MANEDVVFMKRAFKLALLGMGKVAPNPLVGCVIVKNGKIIGEGFHQAFGSAHAEVNAIKNASTKVEGSTVYVTLEPCAHYGKTPPCSDLLSVEGNLRTIAQRNCWQKLAQIRHELGTSLTRWIEVTPRGNAVL